MGYQAFKYNINPYGRLVPVLALEVEPEKMFQGLDRVKLRAAAMNALSCHPTFSTLFHLHT